ncbi:MAG: biopolymer transporter ExbD [Gammaproteobacteria bacterium]
MAFGGFNNRSNNEPMAEINMIPLIDVMLVLLVIFIVTAPLLTHAVKIDLPKVSSSISLDKPGKIELAIDDRGTLYWNGEAIDKDAVIARFAGEARKTPQPELHLRVDKNTRYQVLAEVMAEATKVGLSKIGFVSEPEKN